MVSFSSAIAVASLTAAPSTADDDRLLTGDRARRSTAQRLLDEPLVPTSGSVAKPFSAPVRLVVARRRDLNQHAALAGSRHPLASRPHRRVPSRGQWRADKLCELDRRKEVALRVLVRRDLLFGGQRGRGFPVRRHGRGAAEQAVGSTVKVMISFMTKERHDRRRI